ncbi:MAG: tetratricopeptide repeat protein, partial [Candidatus Nitrosopelagicus sp.]|nr:tetratricopeptide repeat protein [Candidatus Nitrosopelagicus sp.]
MSAKINKASDENLRTALQKLWHLQKQLSLSDSVVEKAAYLYRKSLEKGIVRGRYISTLITTTLYAACVDDFVSKDLKDIANASNETEYDIVRYYKTLTDNITLDKIHADAIEQYDKTLEINPDEGRIQYDKAIECSNSENYRDCVSYCDKIIEIYPTDTGTWNLRCSACQDLNEFEQVIECCDVLTKINPKSESAWYNKGNAYYDLKNYKKAIKCYDKVTRINPEYDDVWN